MCYRLGVAKDWGLEWRLVAAKGRESCRWQSVDGSWISLSLGEKGDVTKVVVSASDGRSDVADGYEEGLNLARRWRASWASRRPPPISPPSAPSTLASTRDSDRERGTSGSGPSPERRSGSLPALRLEGSRDLPSPDLQARSTPVPPPPRAPFRSASWPQRVGPDAGTGVSREPTRLARPGSPVRQNDKVPSRPLSPLSPEDTPLPAAIPREVSFATTGPQRERREIPSGSGGLRPPRQRRPPLR